VEAARRHLTEEESGTMGTGLSEKLGQEAVTTIVAAARGMYPHASLPDEVYLRVADKLGETAEDEEQARVIAAGLESLGPDFASLGDDARLAKLREIEGSEFFALVRGVAVVEVYSSPITWRAFGYEGPSFDQGGYLDRGFRDLDWLPAYEEEN
jgi:hypothetical protein